MPFLMKKSGVAESAVVTRATLDANAGLTWREDEYNPSQGMAGLGGLELPPAFTQKPQRNLCSNATCTNGWTRPWRNRRRPIFEKQWGCCGRCVLAMVQTSVRRELADGGASSLTPHRHRVPLGLVMLAQGWITHPQLQRALTAQRENGAGRIGDWLMRECGLGAEQIVRGLSLQWACPVLTTEGFSPETMALVMPKVFIQQFGLLPLRVAGSRILYLGFADRLDASAALAIEQMTKLKVESGVIEGSRFEDAQSRLLACDGVDAKLETVEDRDVMAAKITAILEQKQPVESRLVRLHRYYWLRIWLESGAIEKTRSLAGKSEDVMDYVFTVGIPKQR